jgi:arginyl-tRNA synthetase
MNILAELKERFSVVLTEFVDDPALLLDMVVPSQSAQFGDYQANVAMPLGNRLKKPPRQVAEQIVEALDVADMCAPPEIAGPGFINLKLQDRWLQSQLETARHDARLGVASASNPRTVVLDFSAPNVAKPMHVGHIRSTVIGDALRHCLRFGGHRVIGDNHLGDWGTQFGMIIYGYRHFLDPKAYQENPVRELGRIYRHVRKLMDWTADQRGLPAQRDRLPALKKALAQRQTSAEQAADDKARKKAKKAVAQAEAGLRAAASQIEETTTRLAEAEADPQFSKLLADHAGIGQAVLEVTARLHEGDGETRALWEKLLPVCRQDIQAIYARLGVTFDQELGESFYQDQLGSVVTSLEEAGLARESDGATCVFLDGFDAPMIVRKKDGAFLYATTDLATIKYRVETWNPDVVLYVVDFRQSEHFEKLFAAANHWGYTDLDLVHVKFGTVLGGDGKPFKTRSGDTVGLEGLLDEAERRAYAVVCQSDDLKPAAARLPEEERRNVARVVGIAALKYADLSQNRTSDYVFSYDKMLALTGNTATYMQYSYARVAGIFQRGEIDIDTLRNSDAKIELGHGAERALGLQLMRFAETMDEVVADYRPNHLTNYLFELAKSFSVFFEQCPVLKASTDDQRNSRLLLCDLTARTLKQGLELLGIEVVERM